MVILIAKYHQNLKKIKDQICFLVQQIDHPVALCRGKEELLRNQRAGTKVCLGTTPNGLKKWLLKGVLEVTKLIIFLWERRKFHSLRSVSLCFIKSLILLHFYRTVVSVASIKSGSLGLIFYKSRSQLCS